ncbi:plakophilin-2-like isoform X2 [Carcharodon carcharias]|uniref:plakophilin-2-like isoform X2 n=1 Tax=Carcharodon carcharias TaxID=13397 RepID=UPI001B7F347D|nr:plakophilin-2-like isoform X2 [Carcharodon carcharias]
MATSPDAFIRTVLRQEPLPDLDSSLAVPSEERLKLSRLQQDDKSFRLRQQVSLSLSRRSRKTSTGRMQRTLSAPDYVSCKTTTLFEYPTLPLPVPRYGYAKTPESMSYTINQMLGNRAALFSSGTGRFLSQGLQSQTIKPTRRIEVSPENSPVLSRARPWMESRFLRKGTVGRDPAMSYGRHASYIERKLGSRMSNVRPVLRSNTRYTQTEVVATPRPTVVSRASSQSSQKHMVTMSREPQSPGSVLADTTNPIAIFRPGLSQSMSRIYERNQTGALDQQPEGVASSYHGVSHKRHAQIVNRFNWNQTSYQTHYSTTNNAVVTEELTPMESPTVEAQIEAQIQAEAQVQAQRAQAQAQVQTSYQMLAYQENYETQGEHESLTESVSGDDDGEWTIETAVSALTHDNVDYVLYGANFIQHECYQRPEAKKELYALDGIGKLITLLNNQNVEVQRATCGAIRNGVYEENDSKLEVQEHNGLQKLMQLLGQSKDLETKKQITGLLWNLSSNEHLKHDLIERTLTHLTTSIIIPFSGWPDGDVKNFDVDSDIFYNTTGCMRNLSSASPEGRKQMRECDGLIDSLVHYIQFTIANNQEDDKSTENCMCILHNLSFQLENELPSTDSERLAWKNESSSQKKSAGCFGARSSRLKEENVVNIPSIEEKRNPRGVEWLWHSLVVRMYLSLIARSTRNCTQEASLGALQNLTASSGPMGFTISETITLKENGLQHIRRMLYSEEPSVQKAAVSLLRNMARNRRVHEELTSLIMPDLLSILPEPDQASSVPNETISFTCHMLNSLIQYNLQHARNFVQNGGLKKLVSISNDDSNVSTSAGKAASNLLYSLWLHRELHTAYKKAGFTKSDFINSRTTKAYHAARERKSFY